MSIRKYFPEIIRFTYRGKTVEINVESIVTEDQYLFDVISKLIQIHHRRIDMELDNE